MNLKKIIISVLALTLMVSCATTGKGQKNRQYDCSERLETAKTRMAKKNFTDAIRILEDVKYQCGGNPLMDSVYYLGGTANLKLKQYTDARIEFERLIREYPRSPLASESQYRIAQMVYLQSNPFNRDQTETKEAVRLLSDFLEQNSENNYVDSAKHYLSLSMEKLAAKEFNNARFYRKQGENEAALVYFRSLLSQYPDSKYTSEALVGIVEVLIDLKRGEDARDVLGEIDESKLNEELKQRFELAKSKLGGSAE